MYMVYALRRNLPNIITTISLNLSGFRPRFVQRSFVSSQKASDIMSKTSTTDRDKASEFFSSFELTLKCRLNRQEVFEQFLEILAEENAEDLVAKITKDYGKVVNTSTVYNSLHNTLMLKLNMNTSTPLCIALYIVTILVFCADQ